MKPLFPLALALGALALAGCAQGNLRTPGSYAALAPPPVRDPLYDPYAAYGSSNAIWRPRNASRKKTAQPGVNCNAVSVALAVQVIVMSR